MFAFLPDAVPVRLTSPPLQQVIVQIKFDSQSRLAQHGGVSAMHDQLGHLYPRLLSEPQTVVTAAPGGVSTSSNPQWRLTDLAGAWSCVVAADSVSLLTNAYTRWEDMRGRLLAVLDALAQAATPRSRERLGLRYVNHIPVGEDGTFGRRVAPELLGLATLVGWRDSVALSLNQVVLRDDDVQIAVKHGFGGDVLAPEGIFVLDIDCATEVPALFDGDAALTLLDELNDAAWRCFSALIHDDYRTDLGEAT